jgi:hypothetical protein
MAATGDDSVIKILCILAFLGVMAASAQATTALSATFQGQRIWYAANENLTVKKYGYAPSAIAGSNGLAHVWFCGNADPGVVKDSIVCMTINRQTDQVVDRPRVVSSGSKEKDRWDGFHTATQTSYA